MRLALVAVFLLTSPLHAQWVLQNSGTAASLRGIHAVGDGRVAWASGTEGTVLRTTDGGSHWTKCAVPPDAEKLDFRGVQAADDRTAVVMSSGKGALSRVYGTKDACRTWNLLVKNPDAEGFFDGVVAGGYGNRMTVFGDSVDAIDVNEKPRHMIRAFEFDMDQNPQDELSQDSDFFELRALPSESSKSRMRQRRRQHGPPMRGAHGSWQRVFRRDIGRLLHTTRGSGRG